MSAAAHAGSTIASPRIAPAIIDATAKNVNTAPPARNPTPMPTSDDFSFSSSRASSPSRRASRATSPTSDRSSSVSGAPRRSPFTPCVLAMSSPSP